MNFLKIYRVSFWFKSLIPVLLGNIFFFVLLHEIPLDLFLGKIILLFLVSSLGFAGFGYLVNDFFDKKTDLMSGKSNATQNLSMPVFILYVAVCFAVAVLPWIFLPLNGLIGWLLLMQFLGYFLYSAPPFRFKNIPFLSNATDAAYAYVFPLLLVYSILQYRNIAIWQYGDMAISLYSDIPICHLRPAFDPNAWIIFLLLIVFFIVGIKNIFIHQLDDLENDKKSSLNSTPIFLGAEKSSWLMKWLIILEVMFNIALLISLITIDLKYSFALLLFLLLLIPTIVYRNMENPGIQRDVKFGLGLNAYYQFYLPLFYLICLSFESIHWLWILLIFLILFQDSSSLKQKKIVFYLFPLIFGLLQKIYHAIRKSFSIVVNQLVYRAFKLFGVDLIKEKKSGFSFLKEKFRR